MDKTNLHWCQNTNSECREIYQKSYNGPLALTKDANRFISKHYDADYQIDTSKVQIAVLGHSKQQFDTIKDQRYLKKVYLDDLDLGKYSQFQSNAYAESRAFLCDDLFDADVEYVGTVTASWNIKYKGFNPIDDFPNWHASKAFVQSQRDDVLLCADLALPAIWFGGDVNFFVLDYLGFSKRQRTKINRVLFGDLKLRVGAHPAPLSNQLICRKNLYNRYTTFLRDREVLERLERLFRGGDMVTKNHLTNQRPIAFIIESITMLWFGMQENLLYIPNEIRPEEWYTPSNIAGRFHWYHHKGKHGNKI